MNKRRETADHSYQFKPNYRVTFFILIQVFCVSYVLYSLAVYYLNSNSITGIKMGISLLFELLIVSSSLICFTFIRNYYSVILDPESIQAINNPFFYDARRNRILYSELDQMVIESFFFTTFVKFSSKNSASVVVPLELDHFDEFKSLINKMTLPHCPLRSLLLFQPDQFFQSKETLISGKIIYALKNSNAYYPEMKIVISTNGIIIHKTKATIEGKFFFKCHLIPFRYNISVESQFYQGQINLLIGEKLSFSDLTIELTSK